MREQGQDRQSQHGGNSADRGPDCQLDQNNREAWRRRVVAVASEQQGRNEITRQEHA